MASDSTTEDGTLLAALCYALKQVGKADLQLKNEQVASISAIYMGNDVLVWLPTGFGKTVCYEALPFMLEQTPALPFENGCISSTCTDS